MIQYKYLRNNLSWQGVWAELKALFQNWRKELKLDLNDAVDVSFRVTKDYTVIAYLTIPNFGSDTKEININKMSLVEVPKESYWTLLASSCSFLKDNALLNSIRVTSEITGDEVFWAKDM